MKTFKEVELNPIQASSITHLVENTDSGDFQQVSRLGSEIAKKVHNNINKILDVNIDTYFFIRISKKVNVSNGALTDELFFRPRSLLLLDDNTLKVDTIEFISKNKYQIKKS